MVLVLGSRGFTLNIREVSSQCLRHTDIQGVTVGNVSIREVIESIVQSIKVCMYMSPIPNGFSDRAISPYSSKIVDK
jgi:hypothetical protein